MADPICPTFASGTISLQTQILNDKAVAGGANGYSGENPYFNTVGSFNNAWNNECLTQSITPTYSSSLLQFGSTGHQS